MEQVRAYRGRVNVMVRSTLTNAEIVEGETIENKIERLVNNKEPITDGAPEIFTERKEGVISAYNIRTDRWEIAADAMDAVSRSIQAKRDNKLEMEKKDVKKGVIEGSEAKSVGGEEAPK